MWYLPQGATCTGLVDSGVRLTVSTFVSPAGNAVTASGGSPPATAERMTSSCGSRTRPPRTACCRARGSSRRHRLRTRGGGDVPAPTGAAPWIARFNSAGAADGDASQGVGAVAVSAVPSALRFASSRELDAKYPLAVPAVGDAELRFVYVGRRRRRRWRATSRPPSPRSAAAVTGRRQRRAGGRRRPGRTRAGSTRLPAPPRRCSAATARSALGYALGCPAAERRAALLRDRHAHAAGREKAPRESAQVEKQRGARRARPRMLGSGPRAGRTRKKRRAHAARRAQEPRAAQGRPHHDDGEAVPPRHAHADARQAIAGDSHETEAEKNRARHPVGGSRFASGRAVRRRAPAATLRRCARFPPGRSPPAHCCSASPSRHHRRARGRRRRAVPRRPRLRAALAPAARPSRSRSPSSPSSSPASRSPTRSATRSARGRPWGWWRRSSAGIVWRVADPARAHPAHRT